MATKLYNSHLNKIYTECKDYYILDTYIGLVNAASEINDKYIIQSYSSKKSDLVNIIIRSVNLTYKTAFNCLETLLNINIIKYNDELSAWELIDMENMNKTKTASDEIIEEKKKYSGFTRIRKFFFSDTFNKMKYREKRIFIYMSQLADSKSTSNYDDYIINLKKPNTDWLRVLCTRNVYYARKTIKSMLDRFKNILIDNSSEKFKNDLAPKHIRKFKFSFTCKKIKDIPGDNEYIQQAEMLYSREFNYIKDKARFHNITLTSKVIAHISRAVSNVKEWFIKERVIQLVLNKYIAEQIHKSREKIKTPYAYTIAVIKAVIDEYNCLKSAIEKNKLKQQPILTEEDELIDDDYIKNLLANI